jgi:hypothetical protein
MDTESKTYVDTLSPKTNCKYICLVYYNEMDDTSINANMCKDASPKKLRKYFNMQRYQAGSKAKKMAFARLSSWLK